MVGSGLCPRVRGRVATAVIAVALALAGGCDAPSTGGPGADPDLSAPSSAPTSAKFSVEDQAVAAYKEFWRRLRYVDDEPEKTWREYLSKVAVDPQLRVSLQATRLQKSEGITLYGEVVHRITDVEVDDDKATVVDCQDASETGQADMETGERNTVGVKRDPVKGSLQLDERGRWKVSKIDFLEGEC